MSEIKKVYPYHDEDGNLLFEVVRYEPKDFRQRQPDGKGGYINNLDGVRRVVYRLRDVIQAVRQGRTIYIPEGEEDVDALVKLELTATTNPMGAGKWDPKEHSNILRGAHVVILPDNDEPGRKHADSVASSLVGVAASVRIVPLPNLPHKGDVSDWIAGGGNCELLEALVSKQACQSQPTTVSLSVLLDDLARFIRRFVVLTSEQLIVVSLWIIHTHAIEAANATPYLAILSPEKRSGKTRLLEILELLVLKAWRTVVPSEAVLYRRIELDSPTLLFDEIDAVFGPKATEHEGLRALLNSGNRRGTTVWRCVGPLHNLRDFRVFCPRAFAGIGNLPDTTMDRSIPIRMVRRTKAEPIERLGALKRRAVEGEATSLRTRIQQWVGGHLEILRNAEPEIPTELNDRAQDGAEPLLAIADAASGDWARLAREALVTIHGSRTPSDESLGIRLLDDVRNLFCEKITDRMSSETLCNALGQIEDAPWGDYYGKKITPRNISAKLKPYGIKPRQIRIGEETCKGYLREEFLDVWDRYLPPLAKAPLSSEMPFQTEHPKQASQNKDLGSLFDPKQIALVSDAKTEFAPLSERVVSDDSDRTLEEVAVEEIDLDA